MKDISITMSSPNSDMFDSSPPTSGTYEENHRKQMEAVYEKIMKRRKFESIIEQQQQQQNNDINKTTTYNNHAGEDVFGDPSVEPDTSENVTSTPTGPNNTYKMAREHNDTEQFYDSNVASYLNGIGACKAALVAAASSSPPNPSVQAVVQELDAISKGLPKAINDLSLNFHRSQREERQIMEGEIGELQGKVNELLDELNSYPSAMSQHQQHAHPSGDEWGEGSSFNQPASSVRSKSAVRQITGQSETLRLGMSPAKSRKIAQTSAGFEHRRALYAGIVGVNIGAASGTMASASSGRSNRCESQTPPDPTPPHLSYSMADSRPSTSRRKGPHNSVGCGVHEGIAMSLAIMVEGLATSCGAEMVRLFLVDDKGNYVNAASYPPNNDDAPSLDDIRRGHRRLGRPIRTCIERNVGIVGHTPEGALPGSDEGALPKDDEEQSTAAEVKCYMCWPIRSRGNPTVALGALEVVNKIDCANARQLDKEAYRSEAKDQGELYNRNLLAHNTFDTDDEARVHCTAESIGYIADRYPLRSPEVLAAATSARSILQSSQLSSGMDHPHLPPEPYQDQLKSLENVMRRVVQAKPQLPVYRGPMFTVTSQINRIDEASQQHHSGGRMRSNSRQPSVTSTTPHQSPPATGTTTTTHSGGIKIGDGQFNSYHWKPPSVLTNMDYNLASLRSMWLQSHEENVAMHEQCRYWSSRARDLGSMTKCFKEAIAKLQKLRSIESVQNYLGGLDLTLRSGDVQGFLEQIAGDETIGGNTIASNNGGTAESAGNLPPHDAEETANTSTRLHHSPSSFTEGDQSRSSNPVNRGPPSPTGIARTLLQSRKVSHVDEGPQNTRTYTVDANAKRLQQEDIANLRAHVNATSLWEHLRTLPPNHQVPTANAGVRSVPTRRPHWEIDQHRRDHAERSKVNPNIPLPVGVFNVAPPSDLGKYRLPRSGRVSARNTSTTE